jgi:alginate O-acetyltransferase complex protein AlgJ
MKKNIIPVLSILTLSVLLIMGMMDFSSIDKLIPVKTAEYFNGIYVESLRKDFDKNIPVRDTAISLWSKLKFTLFKEGSKGELTGSESWLFTSEEYDEKLNAHMSRETFTGKIREVNDYFQTKDISLVVTLIPSKSRIYSEKILSYPQSEPVKKRYIKALEDLESSGVTTIDLEKAFNLKKENSQLFYRYDTHWTYEGTKTASEELSKAIDPLKTIYTLSERQFLLNEEKAVPFRGDLLDYVPSFKPELESYRKIETIDKNPPVLGLFDSVEIPVILVGTSFSADERWNFDDALKMSLQLDVLNLAEEGKGPFPPMEELLESEYFLEINSRIIIWEIPERYIPLY